MRSLIPVTFTLLERDLILGRHQSNIPIAPLIDEDTFRAARVRKNSVVVKLTLDQIEHLMGFVAGDSNHAEDPLIAQQLDELYFQLESVWASYR